MPDATKGTNNAYDGRTDYAEARQVDQEVRDPGRRPIQPEAPHRPSSHSSPAVITNAQQLAEKRWRIAVCDPKCLLLARVSTGQILLAPQVSVETLCL